MRLQQIRNATVIVESAGTRLLVDPWLENKGAGFTATCPWPERNVPSPLVNLPCSVDEVLENIDAVIVTHVHPDHFGKYDAAFFDHALPMFVQNKMDQDALAGWGFGNVQVISDTGISFGVLSLIRVPAQHGLTPELDCGPAMGVVTKAPEEPTLYLAGDTIWYPAVAKSLEDVHPDVTVLNCCGATLATRGRIIMDEEDVLKVCEVAPWTTVVASHMDTVNHGRVPRAYLRTFVDRLGIGKQVLIPKDGEWLTFAY